MVAISNSGLALSRQEIEIVTTNRLHAVDVGKDKPITATTQSKLDKITKSVMTEGVLRPRHHSWHVMQCPRTTKFY